MNHAIGRSRGGLSSKIHVVVDARGLPMRFLLTPGQASDKAIVKLIADHGLRPQIPTQKDRKVQRSVDPAPYRQRNLVERFFNKLKHFRGIATRYNKLARNFLAAIALASTLLWIRHYESTT